MAKGLNLKPPSAPIRLTCRRIPERASSRCPVATSGGNILWSSDPAYTAFGTAQTGLAGGGTNAQTLKAYSYSFTTGQAAWGGVKSSGFGRTSSKHGLYECVRVKYVDSDRGLLRPAWWFPYDAKTERSIRAALDVLYGTGLERWRAAWRSRRELLHIARRSR